MRNDLEYAAQRFAVFGQQVLAPAVYPRAAPLAVEVYQCPDPVPYEVAIHATYEPVSLGWRWGPVWSTAWFRLRGRVPAQLAGRSVALRFSCGTEALLWRDGVPHQGFDVNHDAALLFDPARGEEEVGVFLEAACNHPLGAAAFWWQESEFNRRWSEAAPGRLETAELSAYEPAVWELYRTYEFARQLMLLCTPDARRGQELRAALERATVAIDENDVPASAAGALAILKAALHGTGVAGRGRCHAVGHAHIDTAWLWRIRETKRKCLRSFATVLRLMDQHPDFSFLCSQAQQYAWVEEESPALFEQIARRVKEGRWEASGAMWVEPDCNVPGGESLVRQVLHGARYWESRFGARGRQRLLYLPDTFGFSAALPQIMTLSGLDVFVTNKLSWNDTNEFPYTNFRWRGLDGSEVLAHCTPGRDYNALLSPAELQRGDKEHARKGGATCPVWLQPFGFGDGGGGPTREMILNADLARACEGLPAVALSTSAAFCDELRRERDALRAQGQDLPVWEGELYLEYHRGTYTAQAWLKHAHRRAEQALRAAEWLAFAGPEPPAGAAGADAARRLETAWKVLLLHQFHDILPGSSITAVYDDARRELARLREEYDALLVEGVQRWARQADTTGLTEPMLVLNPASTARSGVVECGGRLQYVERVPALGALIIDRAQAIGVTPVRVEGQTLSNGLIEATIDEFGQVASLRAVGMERDACARRADGSAEPLNQLVLYDDRPRHWDAWDLEPYYLEKAEAVGARAETWTVSEAGPLRAVIEVTRPLGRASRITQRFVLSAGAPRLDVRTQVTWHEEHKLLRALFPVDVRATRATYEIQFGHVERPTLRNTPWEQARFEVCAQRWADLSEWGFGVALLNDGRYGHSCDGNVLGLSLLRSPRFPDPQADMGVHEFTYSLMVHGGDWRAAGVDREAEALNAPLIAAALPVGQRGALRGRWSPFAIEVTGAAGVEVVAVKRAESDDRLIVRLAETHGGRGQARLTWHRSVQEVDGVDLLERLLSGCALRHDAARRTTSLPLRAFEIVTLAVR